MTQDNNDFLAEYVEEVQTYVPIMRSAIGELRANPHKQSAQEELYRLAHIIRGASAMIGIDSLSKVAGRMEESLERTLEGEQLDEKSLLAMEATVDRIEDYCQNLRLGVPVDKVGVIDLAETDSQDFESDVDAMFLLDSMQEPVIDDTDLFATLSDSEPGSELAGEAEEHLETLYQSIQEGKKLDADMDEMLALDSMQEPISDETGPIAALSDSEPDSKLAGEAEEHLETLYQSIQEGKNIDADVDEVFALDSMQEPISDAADPIASLSALEPDSALTEELKKHFAISSQARQGIEELGADMDEMLALDSMQEPISDEAESIAALSAFEPDSALTEEFKKHIDEDSLPTRQEIEELGADMDEMLALDSMQEPISDEAESIAALSAFEPDSALTEELKKHIDEDSLQARQEIEELDADMDEMLALDSMQEPISDETESIAALSAFEPDSALTEELKKHIDEDSLPTRQGIEELDADMDEMLALDSMQEPISDEAESIAALSAFEPDSALTEELKKHIDEDSLQARQEIEELDADMDEMLALDSMQEPISDEAESIAALSAFEPDSALTEELKKHIDEDSLQARQEIEELGADMDEMLALDSMQEPISDEAESIAALPDSELNADSPEIDNEFLTEFLAEAEEHLQILHQSMQKVEQQVVGTVPISGDLREAVRKIRRSVHTIKGAASVIGLADLAAYAHQVEDVLDWLYESAISMEQQMVRLLFDALDLLATIILAPALFDAQRAKTVLDTLRECTINKKEDKAVEVADEAVPDSPEPLTLPKEAEAEVLPPLPEPPLPKQIEAQAIAPEAAAKQAPGKGSLADSLFSDEERQILYEGFLEEAEEHFQQLNTSIQVLADGIAGRVVPGAEHKEEVRKIRRAVHTIKGASAVIGLQDISSYAHTVEDFLDWLYEDASHLDPKMVESLTSALDYLSLLVDSPESAEPSRQADLLQRLQAIPQEEKSAESKPEEPKSEEPKPELKPEEIKPEESKPEESKAEDKFEDKFEEFQLEEPAFDELSDVTMISPAQALAEEQARQEVPVEEVPLQEALTPPDRGIPADMFTAPPEEDAQQEADAVEPRQIVTFEASRTFRINQGQIDILINLTNELLVGISGFDQNMNLFKKALEEMELTSRRLKDIALELETKFEVKALDQLSQHFFHLDKAVADIKTSQSFSEFDALELDRYTQLNLIIRSLNESAIDIAAIHANLGGIYSGIGGDIGRQHRGIRELQVQMLRTRMSPISILAARLNRTMRDVASRLNKRVRMVIEGEQIELDRMILEKLADPFMHLVRNAIHHGIEDPLDRQARQKPLVATIRLSARREGNHLVVRFSDDGQGLDFNAIREKARRSGLWDTVDRMTEEQLTELIFYSGFSTKLISEISGRGVGMDVVRENIKSLQGSVTVETKAGEGTTFVIRIPITLGVVRALLVKIGEVTYGIALDDIKDIHRLDPGNISFEEGTCTIADETIPWYSLTTLLGLAGHDPDDNHSLVLNMFAGGSTIALSIPHITGQKEIVIKGLGTHLRSVAGVSGAAVMGDGSIVPVLDIPDLAKAASRAEYREALAINLEIPSAFTVMIVDDSISIRRVMNRLVSHNGWVPVEAKDGLDAAEQLENGEVRPNVIVLDIEMPRMNGFEFLAKLPHIPGGKGIPVIMLTSRTSDKHQKKAMQLGANAFLNKPVKDEELVETVLRLTGQGKMAVSESGDEVLP